MKRKMLPALILALSIACSGALAWGDKSTTDLYNDALTLLQGGSYDEAGAAFSQLGNYEEANQLAMYCQAIAAGESGSYSLAVNNLLTLGSFRDSALLAAYYSALSYEAAEEYEEAAERFTGLELYKDVSARLDAYPEKILARDYAQADRAEAAGMLETALTRFTALGSYEDSAARAEAVQQKILARDYAAADKAEQDGNLADALSGFKALGSYEDSAARADAVQQKIHARDYAAADKAEQDGDYAAAYTGFTALGSYMDSAARAAAVQDKGNYALGMEYAQNGQFAKAYQTFAALGDYEDSAEKAYVLGVTDFAKVENRKNGVAAFQFHDLWGIINVNTNTTVSPYWDSIGSFNEHGLAMVAKNEKYGYINTQGEVVIPCTWYEVSEFNGDYCTVAKATTYLNDYNYVFGIMDKNGNTITEAQWRTLGDSHSNAWNPGSWDYNYCSCYAPRFSEGKIKVQTTDGMFGFMDETGASVGEIAWTEIQDFSEGLAVVYDGSKYGYIDKNGNVVIQPQYADAKSFSEGLAAVKADEEWQFIDHSNNVIIQPLYSEVNSFSGGKADVLRAGTGWQIIDKDGALLYFISQETIEGYKTAKDLMAAGSYDEAKALFLTLDGYMDSDALAQECEALKTEADYQAAVALMNAEDYDTAISAFSAIGSYKDASALADQCTALNQEQQNEADYQAAVALMQAEDYSSAYRILFHLSIEGYKDAAALAQQCLESIDSYFTVESIGEYGFELNDAGFYESQNAGKDESYALCEITFLTPTGYIYLDCINYAEKLSDYGIVSKLDCSFKKNHYPEDLMLVEKSFPRSENHTEEIQTICIPVPDTNMHTLQIKYIKSVKNSKNNDSFQFKVRFQ